MLQSIVCFACSIWTMPPRLTSQAPSGTTYPSTFGLSKRKSQLRSRIFAIFPEQVPTRYVLTGTAKGCERPSHHSNRTPHTQDQWVLFDGLSLPEWVGCLNQPTTQIFILLEEWTSSTARSKCACLHAPRSVLHSPSSSSGALLDQQFTSKMFEPCFHSIPVCPDSPNSLGEPVLPCLSTVVKTRRQLSPCPIAWFVGL